MTLGPFELEQVVGRGGSATVWRGVARPSGLPVAVKVLTGHDVPSAFRRELNAVARLDHPAITPVLDHGSVRADEERPGLPAGAPYIVTLLADGTLDPRCGAIGWGELGPIIHQLLAGLGHAHAREVLHRDVKPSNVLVSARGPELTDFGLARSTGDPQLGALVGTPAYMAPEQVEGRWRDHGPWTDLYALGATVWAACTGMPPFGVGVRAAHGHLHRELPPFSPSPGAPSALEGWLRRLMAKEPGARFGSAAEAGCALGRFEPAPPPAVRANRGWWAASAGLRLFGLREPALVGREAEQQTLRSALARAEAGSPTAVWLEGAAGTGKTRLARWLAETAHQELGARLWRASHAARPGPHDGLRPLVLALFGCADLGPADAVDRITRATGFELGDPRLERLAGWLEPSPSGAARPRIEALADHLSAESARCPVVLSLDDLQWGTDARQLARALLDRPGRVMVVGTIGREAAAEQGFDGVIPELVHPRAERCLLGPLSSVEQATLVAGLLPLEPMLTARVVDRTDGNPLFATQLMADWVGRDGLAHTPAGLGLRVHDDRLPPSVEAVWAGRVQRLVDALGPDDERALELAAALGTTADEAEWRAVCRAVGPEPSDALIDALERAGLATLTGRSLRLCHGMFRESVLARAERSGRLRERHRAVATVLDAGADRPWARVGQHFLAAGELASALTPLYVGASRAVQADEFDRAEALLAERTRALLALGADDADPRWVEHWLVSCELRLWRDGDWAAARSDAARGWELARSAGAPLREARAAQLVGLTFDHEVGPASALPWLDQAAEAAARSGEHWMISNIAASRCSVRTEAGIGLAEVERDLMALLADTPGDEGYVLLQLARAAEARGDVAQTLRWVERAEVTHRRERRADALAACRRIRAVAARAGGDLERARDGFVEVSTFYRGALPLLVHEVELELAEVEAALGDPEAARARVRQVLAEVGPDRAELVGSVHAQLALLATTEDEFDRSWRLAVSCFERSGVRVPRIRSAALAALASCGDGPRADRLAALVSLHTPT
ncbi:MAG: AAA family ATPase [Myxococcota bacterium]